MNPSSFVKWEELTPVSILSTLREGFSVTLMTFRRFLAGSLLLWSFFSFSLSLEVTERASAQGAPGGSGQSATPAVNTPPVTTNSSTAITPQRGTPAKTILPIGDTKYPGVDISKYVGQEGGSSGVVAAVKNLFTTAKQILGPIMVFIIAGFGIQLVIAGGNEEKFNAASKNFLYILIGTAIVVLANFLTDTFSLYQQAPGGTTTFVSGPEQIIATTGRITAQLDLIIKFLRYVLGGVAVFYVVRSGSAMIINADEETANKQKDVFVYGFVGFLLIMVSEALVRTVFSINPTGGPFGSFFVENQVDVGGGLSLLSNVTNLLLAGLSGLFLFSLVAGGAMYAFSAGNEQRGEQATKVIIGSLVGLVIAFSSYTLVAEFSSGGQQIRQATIGTTPLLAPTVTPPAPSP